MKYMRILSLVFLPLVIFGQTQKTTEPVFDIVDFNKKFEVARWLVAYDTVAWKTTDLVMAGDKSELARLGREWFCFQDSKGIWHAVYGKLENNKFDQVFHYVVDGAGKITRTTEKIDEEFLIAHAKARINIKNAKSMSAVIKSGSEYVWVHAEKDAPSSGNSNAKP